MSHRDDNAIPDSPLPPLKAPPEFTSEIPAHLLDGASRQDQHIMGSLSIGNQYDKWLVEAIMLTHNQVRATNGRLVRAESDIANLKDDKQFWGRGWRFLVIAAGVVGGLVSFFILVGSALSGTK